jgi:hypothetical protein
MDPLVQTCSCLPEGVRPESTLWTRSASCPRRRILLARTPISPARLSRLQRRAYSYSTLLILPPVGSPRTSAVGRRLRSLPEPLPRPRGRNSHFSPRTSCILVCPGRLFVYEGATPRYCAFGCNVSSSHPAAETVGHTKACHAHGIRLAPCPCMMTISTYSDGSELSSTGGDALLAELVPCRERAIFL